MGNLNTKKDWAPCIPHRHTDGGGEYNTFVSVCVSAFIIHEAVKVVKGVGLKYVHPTRQPGSKPGNQTYIYL